MGGNMQNVTIYYRVVYTLAAVIFGGYAAWLVMAASRARDRMSSLKNR